MITAMTLSRWESPDVELSGQTVLITGGASGIGFGLAEQFLLAGSTVIICGRSEDKLAKARDQHAQLHTRVCDVADPQERVALFDWASSTFPTLNVLVNNAGIQQRIALLESPPWESIEGEIAINVAAPIHLTGLFVQHLTAQPEAAIINVTSGLAFIPLAHMPIYCATKAALHSFTLSLRRQLSATSVTVVEVVPPAVDTDLGGAGLHTTGTPLPEYINGVVEQLKDGRLEISHGLSATASRASRDQLDQLFVQMNAAGN
jgi:uncharacterized oxidoreductase